MGTILDYDVFIDIGCGNVSRLFWETSEDFAAGINTYNLSIDYVESTDSEGNEITCNIFSADIGKINEFFTTSELLNQVNLSTYKLIVKLTALDSLGVILDTAYETFWVSRGCGTYVKVANIFSGVIFKRAAAFIRLSDIKNNVGSSWILAQDLFIKNSENSWTKNDLDHEILLDSSGEVIKDSNNSPIYIY